MLVDNGIDTVDAGQQGSGSKGDAPSRASERRKSAAYAAVPRRILVVDDNVDLTQTLKMLLEALGHEVYSAYEGRSALELARRFLPDVVILDIGLPGMNGLDVARQLRIEFPRRELLLIALTGYGRAQDCRRSRQVGFDHHLVKPLDFGRLQSVLASGTPD
ncbi:MAG: response regulator [Thiohalobacteraceae bacterium]